MIHIQEPFDPIIDRAGTGSVKWEKYSGSDIIPMWVADMDFAVPPPVIEALKKRADHGIFGYTLAEQCHYDAVVDWVRYRHGWQIEPEWIVWMSGLVSALNTVCRGFAEEGQEVISFTPIYIPFLQAPSNMGRRLLRCPLKRVDGRYTFDLERFESLITENTKVLLLCSPGNPVGRVWSESELRNIGEICIANDIVICSDEIHCDLTLDGAIHYPTAKVSLEIAGRTITLMAPSKTFNVPGLGCSFAIISNDSLRRQFKHAGKGIVPHVNTFGYTACKAAFNDSRQWHGRLLEYLSGNRKLVYEMINSIDGMWVDKSEATYLAWINIEGLNIEKPVEFFEKTGVGIEDGADYGGKGFIRMNFGCPRARLVEGLNRIEKAVRSL